MSVSPWVEFLVMSFTSRMWWWWWQRQQQEVVTEMECKSMEFSWITPSHRFISGVSLVLQGDSWGEVPSYLYWLHRELKSLNESRYLTLGDSRWISYYPKCPVWGGSYRQSQKTEDTLNVCACSKHFSAKRSGMGEALGESSEENLSLYTCFTCFISWSKLLILTAIFSKEMFLDA